MKTETTFEVTPPSQCRCPYGLQRRYDETAGRTRRIDGDTELLVRLERECAALRPYDPDIDGPSTSAGPTVGELHEELLRSIVRDVEDLYPHWQLGGEPSQPTPERLDAHFADVQAAWLAWRTEQEDWLRWHARESAELEEQLLQQRVKENPTTLGPVARQPSCRRWNLAPRSRERPMRTAGAGRRTAFRAPSSPPAPEMTRRLLVG